MLRLATRTPATGLPAISTTRPDNVLCVVCASAGAAPANEITTAPARSTPACLCILDSLVLTMADCSAFCLEVKYRSRLNEMFALPNGITRRHDPDLDGTAVPGILHAFSGRMTRFAIRALCP